jgi:hypothetical protein
MVVVSVYPFTPFIYPVVPFIYPFVPFIYPFVPFIRFNYKNSAQAEDATHYQPVSKLLLLPIKRSLQSQKVIV